MLFLQRLAEFRWGVAILKRYFPEWIPVREIIQGKNHHHRLCKSSGRAFLGLLCG
jgi:hypothetical protein